MSDTHYSPTARSLSPAAQAVLEAVAGRARPGTVIVVAGLPASGKTTTSTTLADLSEAIVLDKDTYAPLLEQSIMSELTGDAFDRDSDTYRTMVSPHLYASLATVACAVAQKCPVILDAPFLSFVSAAAASGISLGDRIKAVAGDPAVQIVTVWVTTDPAHIRSRMLARGAARDASKLADFDTYRTTVLESGICELGRKVTDHHIET
ncbi:AAA family ATPase [Nocardia asteroides]|uniref:AAA family ATPase n=1 Tax=Nocardia asteroides TaxID=1824 RepID=UPI0037CC5F2E